MRSARRWGLGALLVIGIVTVSAWPGYARADQEGRMPLSHLELDSKGMDNSGPVHVEATQSGNGITDLRVSAFGRTQAATAGQLALLGGKSINGIAITYSRGYASVGGRTVYLLLCRGFSSGVRVVAVVTITEAKGIRISPGEGAEP